MNTLTILVGIPASGKSKWVKENSSQKDVVISLDMLRKMTSGGDLEAYSYNSVIRKMVIPMMRVAFLDGYNVIFDACNVHSRLRRLFVEAFGNSVKYEAVVFFSTPTHSYNRILTDLENGVERCNVSLENLEDCCQDFWGGYTDIESDGYEIVAYEGVNEPYANLLV